MSLLVSVPTPTRPRGRGALVVAAVAAVGIAASTACGDDPFAIRWESSRDTVLLYSLARPELGLPSGFNFYNRVPVRVEQANATGNWDVAVGTRDDQIVLLPPGALNIGSRARIAELPNADFDDVVEAPADTAAYTALDAVPVRMGSVYVIQTSQRIGTFGTSCVYYAKLAPVDIGLEQGTLRFYYDSSPVCNDRALIPRD
jgi:hypothetical protein